MLPKILFIVFSLFFSLPKEDNIIEWSPTRKLTWADFRGVPDPSSTNAALTNSSITLSSEYSKKGIKYIINCKFNKLLSWGRIRNEYILNHEQGHFDIAEAHARLLFKNLNNYSFNNTTAGDDINRIYNATMKEHVNMQKQYDLLTNHSLDSVEQKKWDGKISGMLKDLEKFSDYK